MDKIDVALNLMTPRQRRAWELRLECKTQSEIAKIMRINQSSVSKLLSRGKKRAKKNQFFPMR